jgi:hypothetical protein
VDEDDRTVRNSSAQLSLAAPNFWVALSHDLFNSPIFILHLPSTVLSLPLYYLSIGAAIELLGSQGRRRV